MKKQIIENGQSQVEARGIWSERVKASKKIDSRQTNKIIIIDKI